jgi:very-short-patch-repair endonuclease
MRPESRTVEQEIARIAGEAHGVVTRAELLRAGVCDAGIKRRVRKGSLIPKHRGVFRVGHCAPSLEATYLGAVRACGHGAVLSGRAAGHLLGLLRGAPPPPEVTTPTERRVEGVTTRRCRAIDRADVMTVRGIPVTSVPRTLVDLAALLTVHALARACHEAGVRYRTTPTQVEAVLSRRPTSPGAGKLRKVINGDAQVTLSRLERAFLRMLRDARLPLPETNRIAGGRRVDCRWPEYRLTIELDGYRFHNSRHAWEQDRRREREARARGDEFRRYTYGDVVEDRRSAVRELRALLKRKRPA